MRILFCAYRSWALDIYNEITKLPHTFKLIKFPRELNYKDIITFNPDYILWYGWSWYIDKIYREMCVNIVLHNAPLPKYRGGTPIQHQIINNESKSAVTLFIPDDGIDTGNIIAQKEISLEGHLKEIFQRITNAGIELTIDILNNGFKGQSQNDNISSTYKRRTPEMSEITIDDFIHKDSIYLYNFIRMLEDPYPNAFYRCKDGKKLYFKLVEVER